MYSKQGAAKASTSSAHSHASTSFAIDGSRAGAANASTSSAHARQENARHAAESDFQKLTLTRMFVPVLLCPDGLSNAQHRGNPVGRPPPQKQFLITFSAKSERAR